MIFPPPVHECCGLDNIMLGARELLDRARTKWCFFGPDHRETYDLGSACTQQPSFVGNMYKHGFWLEYSSDWVITSLLVELLLSLQTVKYLSQTGSLYKTSLPRCKWKVVSIYPNYTHQKIPLEGIFTLRLRMRIACSFAIPFIFNLIIDYF